MARTSTSRTPGGIRLLRGIDAMGVRSTAAHWSLAPPDLARRLRVRVLRVGDALMTIAGASDALRMNRVLGFGHRGRARPAMVDEMIAAARAAKLCRFALMLGPGPQAARIERWLTARGFTRDRGLSLLMRDARLPVPRARQGPRVRRARRADAEAILDIHESAFGNPRSRRAWGRATLLAGGSEHYLATIDGEIAAVGAVRMDGRLAWLGSGATRTRFRRHGAHAALIAARLRRARRAGCRWVWVETSPPEPGRPDGSRRNLLRAGFQPVCERPRFVWHAR